MAEVPHTPKMDYEAQNCCTHQVEGVKKDVWMGRKITRKIEIIHMINPIDNAMNLIKISGINDNQKFTNQIDVSSEFR